MGLVPDRAKKDGKPYILTGEFGKPLKGSFVWEKDVTPEFFWYNGRMDYVLLTDTIDVKQPYDKGNNTMAVPHLFGKDPSAYWKSYDWN